MAYIFLNAKLDNETATASILQLQGQLMGDIKVIEEWGQHQFVILLVRKVQFLQSMTYLS